MKELLINFYCPATSKSYDFWVPKTMQVTNVIEQICSAVCEYENQDNIFPKLDTLVLYSYLNRATLPANYSLEQVGVRSGDKLALM